MTVADRADIVRLVTFPETLNTGGSHEETVINTFDAVSTRSIRDGDIIARSHSLRIWLDMTWGSIEVIEGGISNVDALSVEEIIA